MMYSSLPSLSLFSAFTVVIFFLSSTDMSINNNSGGAVVSSVSAFSFSEIVLKKATYIKNQKNPTTTTSLAALSTTTRTAASGVTEEDATYIFNKAREFAFHDDFNPKTGELEKEDYEYDRHYHSLSDEKTLIKESKFWLREMIHLQSGCVAGTLVGHDLCENQDVAAEIVSRLRFKIEKHERRVEKRTKGSDSVVPTIATELSVGALLVVLVIFWTTLDLQIDQSNDDNFSMRNYQEWAAILKEKGYFVSMVERCFGGSSGGTMNV